MTNKDFTHSASTGKPGLPRYSWLIVLAAFGSGVAQCQRLNQQRNQQQRLLEDREKERERLNTWIDVTLQTTDETPVVLIYVDSVGLKSRLPLGGFVRSPSGKSVRLNPGRYAVRGCLAGDGVASDSPLSAFMFTYGQVSKDVVFINVKETGTIDLPAFHFPDVPKTIDEGDDDRAYDDNGRLRARERFTDRPRSSDHQVPSPGSSEKAP